MFITPSFKKSLIVEQFQGNYLNKPVQNTHLLSINTTEKHFNFTDITCISYIGECVPSKTD